MSENAAPKSLKEHVADIEAERTQCNCDLDKWEPTRETGHSFVCRIHKVALMRRRDQSR